MPSTITFNPNTYAGEVAGGYVSRALLGARSLDAGLLNVLPNVKKRAVLRGVEQQVVFQDAAADFNAEGDTTVDERYLDPVEMSVMFELRFRDLIQSWEAASLRPGANGDIPADLAEFLIARMQTKIGIGIEKLIWQGKVGSEFTFTAAYPGLLSLINASSASLKMAATVGQLAIQGISIATNVMIEIHIIIMIIMIIIIIVYRPHRNDRHYYNHEYHKTETIGCMAEFSWAVHYLRNPLGTGCRW